jgi:hypothetical protein
MNVTEKLKSIETKLTKLIGDVYLPDEYSEKLEFVRRDILDVKYSLHTVELARALLVDSLDGIETHTSNVIKMEQ